MAPPRIRHRIPLWHQKRFLPAPGGVFHHLWRVAPGAEGWSPPVPRGAEGWSPPVPRGAGRCFLFSPEERALWRRLQQGRSPPLAGRVDEWGERSVHHWLRGEAGAVERHPAQLFQALAALWLRGTDGLAWLSERQRGGAGKPAELAGLAELALARRESLAARWGAWRATLGAAPAGSGFLLGDAPLLALDAHGAPLDDAAAATALVAPLSRGVCLFLTAGAGSGRELTPHPLTAAAVQDLNRRLAVRARRELVAADPHWLPGCATATGR